MRVTDGTMHELNLLDIIKYEPNGFFILDRGFVDYKSLYKIDQQKARFVTRAKTTMKCRRIYSAKVDRTKGVLYDQTIMLVNFYASKITLINLGE